MGSNTVEESLRAALLPYAHAPRKLGLGRFQKLQFMVNSPCEGAEEKQLSNMMRI
jgi:hypothetical protein